VQELEGGAGVDDLGVLGASAGADICPVAERRPEPLAAGQHEIAQRGEGLGQVRVDRRPPLQLAVEEAGDTALDPHRNAGQAGGRYRDSRYDSHQLSSPG